MIRVIKPVQPPAILRNRGRVTTQGLCDTFDEAPQDFLSGVRTFDEFDSGLYGAKSVKNALRRAQHEKCCFCESKFTHVGYGDVEHFRPKAGFQQQAEDPLGRPGYYWLAYEWSNLFFSCQICNQRHKKNLFPLADPARRARSHRDDVRAEEPLLIDPSSPEIASRLGFRAEYAYAIEGNASGEATIEVVGLNREELVEVRRDHLAPLRLLKETNDLLAQEIRRAEAAGEPLPSGWREAFARNEALLEGSMRDEAEYAVMTRAALAESGRPAPP